MPPVTRPVRGAASLKPALVLAGAAVGLIVFTGLWIAGGRDGRRADAMAHVNRAPS